MRRRTIVLLQCATALGSMGYGTMFTILDDFRNDFGISESGLGVMVGVGFFTSFVAQIFIAPLADKGLAKKMVLFGLAVQIIGNLAMAFGHTFPVLLAGRLAMGLGSGVAGPAVRRIIILSDPLRMGSNLGRILSADVGGFALGPVVSAATAGSLGLGAPFILISVAVMFVMFALSSLHVDEADRGSAPTQKLAFDLLRVRPLAGAIIIGLSLFLMIGVFDSLWSVMMDDLGAPSWVMTIGITIFVLPMIFLGPTGGRMTQRIGPFRSTTIGLTLGSIFMASYGMIPSPYLMPVIGVVHGIVDGLTITGGASAIALVAPRERLAAAQGLYGGLQTLTGGLTAIAAGAAYEQWGRTPAYLSCSALMLLLIWGGAWLARDSYGLTVEDSRLAGQTTP